jgi:hypothetical protein
VFETASHTRVVLGRNSICVSVCVPICSLAKTVYLQASHLETATSQFCLVQLLFWQLFLIMYLYIKLKNVLIYACLKTVILLFRINISEPPDLTVNPSEQRRGLV